MVKKVKTMLFEGSIEGTRKCFSWQIAQDEFLEQLKDQH